MENNWLEIADEAIDTTQIEQQIYERMAKRNFQLYNNSECPKEIARKLWQEMIGNTISNKLAISLETCDIVPRNYVIDWRIPILGPINALLRRLINAEIRRFLSSSLEQQSYVNRQVYQLLHDLLEENAQLRREIESIRKTQKQVEHHASSSILS